MKIAIIFSRVLLGISGVALLLLGTLFWTGHALALVPLHMLLGALLVLSLWMLVAISLYARTAMGFAAAVLVWS